MIQRKTLFALTGAVLCGTSTFLLLHRTASGMERKIRKVPVLVCLDYIPAHSAIRPDQVEVRKVPEAYVNPGAMSDPSQLTGLVSLAPLSSGEQVLANKLSLSGGSLSSGLEPGKRAYCLAVSETSGVGGWLRPGSRVDVLARTEAASRRITAFALQNVRVLAVGGSSGPGGAEEGSGGYRHVTLSLTAQECEMLVFLEDRAALQLVLRCEGDEGPADAAPMEESEVLSRLGRPARGARTIEIIRGGER